MGIFKMCKKSDKMYSVDGFHCKGISLLHILLRVKQQCHIQHLLYVHAKTVVFKCKLKL